MAKQFKDYLEAARDEDDEGGDVDTASKVYKDLEKQLKPDINAIVKKSRVIFNQSKIKYGYKGSIDDLLDDIFQMSAGVEEEDLNILATVLMGRM